MRTFLACLLLCLASSSAGADQVTTYFSLHDLGHGAWAAIEMPGSHAGGNAGFVVGDDGVLVVDDFGLEAASEVFLATIRKVTDKPIRYVVNTHYHIDHATGNGLFAQQGATIVGQRNVRAWIRSENHRIILPPATTDEMRAIADAVPPSLVYEDGMEIYLGTKRVILRVMPGHTGSDTVVIVPDAKVVYTGDLYWDHSLPNLVDADTRQQMVTLETLAHDYPDAAFVPGHGKFVPEPELGQWDMAHAADLLSLRAYLGDLRAGVAGALKEGKSGQALQDEVLPKLKQQYGGLFGFDFFAAKNIAQTEAELTGKKDLPKPAP